VRPYAAQTIDGAAHLGAVQARVWVGHEGKHELAHAHAARSEIAHVPAKRAHVKDGETAVETQLD
jgi:hypothetical protein